MRKLKLIYGNIAKTLNSANLNRVVSGRVQRWVRVNPFIIETVPFLILIVSMFVFAFHLHLTDKNVKDINSRLQKLELLQQSRFERTNTLYQLTSRKASVKWGKTLSLS